MPSSKRTKQMKEAALLHSVSKCRKLNAYFTTSATASTSTTQANSASTSVSSKTELPQSTPSTELPQPTPSTELPRTEKFHPPKTFSFPVRSFGVRKNKRNRHFQYEWCQDFDWLHYDVEKDAAFCHVCMMATQSNKILSKKGESSFSKDGFTNWKKATRSFQDHQLTDVHREAHDKVVCLRNTDVLEALSQQHKDDIQMNRDVFMKVLENLQFLSRQAINIRGDGSDENSNFNQLFLLRAIDDPSIKKWIMKKQLKYTSPEIQNECLKIMAHQILRKVATSIQNAKYYSIMADECTDVSNDEQFTICLRWVDEFLCVHEDFIGLFSVENISSETLYNSIKDVLNRLSLQISKCRGQCYDGAANMAGSKTGVATRVLNEEPKATFIHCHGHALNLAVADTLKDVRIVRDTLDTVFEITKLVKFSPKRENKFDKIKEEIGSGGSGIRVMCQTRWTVRGETLESIRRNYKVLIRLFEECLEERKDNAEIRSRMNGVLSQMKTFSFLFGMMIAERIFKHTDNLSRTIQRTEMTASQSQEVSRCVTKVIEKMRSDESFALFWLLVKELADELGINACVLPRQRKAPKKIEIGSSLEKFPETAEDFYRRIYFQLLDQCISCIQTRFNQPGYESMKILETVLLCAINNTPLEVDLLAQIKNAYNEDINISLLTTQIETFQSLLDVEDKPKTMKDIFSFISNLPKSYHYIISEIITIVELLLVLPATNAVSERSFSAMKRVKTYLQSTMGQSRLNHLMVLHVNREKTDKLDLKKVANDFVSYREQRFSFFGTF